MQGLQRAHLSGELQLRDSPQPHDPHRDEHNHFLLPR
jgi:hypothetical protein